MANNTLGPFEYSASSQQSFYFVQAVNGIEIEVGDIIGSFNGDICVGAKAWIGPYTDIPVMGDEHADYTTGYCVPGDIPSFKLYKIETGEIYDLIVPNGAPPWVSLGLPFIALAYEEDANITYATAVVNGNTKVFMVDPADALN